MIYISPTEPPAIKNLLAATIDSLPEQYGCDYIWGTPFGLAGVQRKRFPSDFLASMNDDRFAKEMLQMEAVTWRMLIMEIDKEFNGKLSWGPQGDLLGVYGGGININRLDSILDSIDYFRGIRVRWTANGSETAKKIKRFYTWTGKESHTGYCAERNGPPKTNDKQMKVEWREWILMGFPGIGLSLAKGILSVCAEPLIWNPNFNLEDVPNIAKGRANTLRNALKP